MKPEHFRGIVVRQVNRSRGVLETHAEKLLPLLGGREKVLSDADDALSAQQ